MLQTGIIRAPRRFIDICDIPHKKTHPFRFTRSATLAGRDVVQIRSSAAAGVEMPGYMTDIQASRELDPVGRVVVLEDVDDDGKMDKRTVFAGFVIRS